MDEIFYVNILIFSYQEEIIQIFMELNRFELNFFFFAWYIFDDFQTILSSIKRSSKVY